MPSETERVTQDDLALDRPILVTGTPRSGKTCVSELLERAPEFLHFPEPLPIWNLGARRREDDARGADDAGEAVRLEIRRTCARALRRAGRRRYVDDLAYHALRIPFVHRVMPEAKIVHVVRDPARTIPEMTYWWGYTGDTLSGAIARGRKSRSLPLRTLPGLALRFARNWLHGRLRGRPASWGPRVPDLDDFAASHGPAEIAAFQWQHLVEAALEDLAALSPDCWLEVRYERLLAEPEAEVRRLAHFCEVEDPEALVEFGRGYLNPEHPVFAEVQPSDAEWKAIRERIGPLARRLGYA